MPYSVVDDAAGCSGYAVVKDGTGEVMGCHETEGEAQAQLTALNIAEFGQRAVDLTLPAYVRAAARRGLELRADGLGGDGLTERTIREARAMAGGDISEDKVVRANAWGARHEVDLEASKNSDPNDPEWPGAGAVAHYLWGIDPLDPQPARAWFARKVEQVLAERAAGDPPAVIADVDGTILTFEGDPIQRVIDYLNDEEGDLVVITARLESERETTTRQLAATNLRRHRLVMKPSADVDSVAYKVAAAEELLRTRDVYEAIDDNADVRAAYRRLGIDAMAPGDIESEDSPDDEDYDEGSDPMERSAPMTNLVRAASLERAAEVDVEGRVLSGYFSVFDQWYEVNSAYEGRFMERIAPGAFTETLARNADRIKVLYDHGADPSLGNKPLGTIRSMGEDKRGAYYEVELIDTDYNRNFIVPAARAGLLGSSFRFMVTTDEWREPRRASTANPMRLPERTITAVDVFEFGPVTFPANPGVGAVAVRSMTDEWFDRLLHDPAFVARFTARVGLSNVERALESAPVANATTERATVAAVDGPHDVRSDEQASQPTDGRSKARTKNQRLAIVAKALPPKEKP